MKIDIDTNKLLESKIVDINTKKGLISIAISEDEIFLSVEIPERYIGQCHLNMQGHERLLERMGEILDDT